MCQNLLYRRAGITAETLYQGEFAVLAEFSAAKSVLDMVLSDFESWNINYLTAKLREKIVLRKSVEYIECGFFLRCLVEYYKIERVNRYNFMMKLCAETKDSEVGLKYTSFMAIINRLTELPIEKKLSLFRDCFSLGGGKINHDVIFTVCTEQLVFLKYLRLKCFFVLPSLIQKRPKVIGAPPLSQDNKKGTIAQIICLQPSQCYLYDIFIKLGHILRDDVQSLTRIESFGVPQLLYFLQRIERLLYKNSTLNSSHLRCRHFLHFIAQFMARLRDINYLNFYELLSEQSKRKAGSPFWIDFDETELCDIINEEFKVTFKVFHTLSDLLTWKQKVYNFRLNCAARKIQRHVRNTLIKPFIELYKKIYTELKKTVAQPDERPPKNARSK